MNAREGPLLILFEEDEEDYFLLSRFLSASSFQVERASSYKEVLSLAAESSPGAILYAARSNDYHGCQLLKSAPETRDVPLLLIVPQDQREVWRRNAAYADEAITKPLNLQELKRRLDWLLRSVQRPAQPPSTQKSAAVESLEATTSQPPEPAPKSPQAATGTAAPPSPEKPLPETEEEDSARKLYQETVAYLLQSFQDAALGKKLDLPQSEELVARIHERLLLDHSLTALALDRQVQYSLSAHSTNVCILSLLLNIHLPEPVQDRILLGQAALFHDIGSVQLSQHLLYKLGRFTSGEIAELQRRPEYGRDLILSQDSALHTLANIVYQVYERLDGSGYPQGLGGEEICREAQIIGLADYYEGITHSRPYREGLSGLEALTELVSRPESLFATDLLMTFIRSISLYAINEYVMLSSGEIARVVGLTANPVRPVVEIFVDPQGRRLDEPREVNLAEQSQLVISKSLTAKDLLLEFSQ